MSENEGVLSGFFFFVSAGEQKGEEEAVKIYGFGGTEWLLRYKKSKAKVGARLVLASGEEDSGRKIQTSRGGGCLQRDRVRSRVCFFCIFLMFQNYPPFV